MGNARLLGTRRGACRLGLAIASLLLVALALAPANAAAATLFGTVSSQAVGAAVMPEAGATVTVLDPQTQATVALATTGIDGTYSAVVPDGTYDVRVDPATGDGFVSTTVEDIAVATSRRLDVVLVSAGVTRLSGVVHKSDGTVIAGAEVVATSNATGESWATTTGADGSFSLVVAPGSYGLGVSDGSGTRDGLPPFWSFGTRVDASTDRTVDVTLPPVATLRVEALGSDDAPIAHAVVDLPPYGLSTVVDGLPAGWQVSGEADLSSFSAFTDADGTAQFVVFDGSSAGGATGRVSPQPESGYGETIFTAPEIQGDTSVVVHPPGLVRVSGTLRKADGTPVVGAVVQLTSLATGEESDTSSAVDGSYSFSVAPGSYSLRAYDAFGMPDGLPPFWAFGTRVELTTDRTVDMTLPPVATLTVRVLGSDDAPIARAVVEAPGYSLTTTEGGVQFGGEANEEEGGVFSGFTDAAGEARFVVFDGSAPPSGSSGLVTPPVESGYGPTSFVPPAIDGDTATVVRPGGQVHLSGVIEGPQGPVAGAFAELFSSGVSTAAMTSGPDGAFGFTIAPGSSLGLEVTGPTGSPGLPHDWWLETGFADFVADTAVDLTLPPVSTLTVRVLGADGAPLRGALVNVPEYSRVMTFDGVTTAVRSGRAFAEWGFQGVTDTNGEVHVGVFDGSSPPDGYDAGEVVSPSDSGCGRTTFASPAMEGDATVVVRFTSCTPPDTTAPSIACDPAPAGWHTDDVSVACTASDDGSRLADPADASFSLSTSVGDGNEDAAAQTGTHQVCDRSGNCATAGPVGPIEVDRAAPRISYGQAADGANGWWVHTPATVHVTATDLNVASLACAVDGVSVRRLALTSGPDTLEADVVVRGDGRHSVSCTAADTLGHVGTSDQPVLIDLKAPRAPTITADRLPDYAGNGGWYADSVTVTVADTGDPVLADGSPGSGIDPASVPAPQTFDTSGRHVVSAAVDDLAGHASSTTRHTFKVDADPPQTTLTCPAGSVRAGARASARWRDADGESGLATPGSGTIALDTSSAGTFTVQHTAADNVGHSAASSCTYSVG